MGFLIESNLTLKVRSRSIFVVGSYRAIIVGKLVVLAAKKRVEGFPG